jgi:hypothetical protein
VVEGAPFQTGVLGYWGDGVNLRFFIVWCPELGQEKEDASFVVHDTAGEAVISWAEHRDELGLEVKSGVKVFVAEDGRHGYAAYIVEEAGDKT